jgi:hypothetical protein
VRTKFDGNHTIKAIPVDKEASLAQMTKIGLRQDTTSNGTSTGFERATSRQWARFPWWIRGAGSRAPKPVVADFPRSWFFSLTADFLNFRDRASVGGPVPRAQILNTGSSWGDV